MALPERILAPKNPEQLVKKLEHDLADPAFVSSKFPVPFEIDGLTEMAVKVVARAYRADVQFADQMCLASRIDI